MADFERIYVKVSPEMKEEIAKISTDDGMTISEFVRNVLNDRLREIRRRASSERVILTLIAEVNRLKRKMEKLGGGK